MRRENILNTENPNLNALLKENEKVLWDGNPSEDGIKAEKIRPKKLALIPFGLSFIGIILIFPYVLLYISDPLHVGYFYYIHEIL